MEIKLYFQKRNQGIAAASDFDSRKSRGMVVSEQKNSYPRLNLLILFIFSKIKKIIESNFSSLG